MKDLPLRVLVVYYSLEGSTRFAAQTIAAKTGADLLELHPKREIPSRGFMKYFWGGKQAVMKEEPELENVDKMANDYDLVFIGTPVWAFTYAPPLNTFFRLQHLAGRKIALFCCHEGSRGKTFVNLHTALEGNAILGELELVRPTSKERKALQKEVETWAVGMVDGASGQS